jgi:hypothetical protein
MTNSNSNDINGKVICSQCNKEFKNQKGLDRHLKYFHLKEGETKPERFNPTNDDFKFLIQNYNNMSNNELRDKLKISNGQLLSLIDYVNANIKTKDGGDLLPKKAINKQDNKINKFNSLKDALSELNIDFEVRTTKEVSAEI